MRHGPVEPGGPRAGNPFRAGSPPLARSGCGSGAAVRARASRAASGRGRRSSASHPTGATPTVPQQPRPADGRSSLPTSSTRSRYSSGRRWIRRPARRSARAVGRARGQGRSPVAWVHAVAPALAGVRSAGQSPVGRARSGRRRRSPARGRAAAHRSHPPWLATSDRIAGLPRQARATASRSDRAAGGMDTATTPERKVRSSALNVEALVATCTRSPWSAATRLSLPSSQNSSASLPSAPTVCTRTGRWRVPVCLGKGWYAGRKVVATGPACAGLVNAGLLVR